MDFSNTSQAIYFTNTTSFLFNHVIIVEKPFSFVPRSCLCVRISPYTRRWHLNFTAPVKVNNAQTNYNGFLSMAHFWIRSIYVQHFTPNRNWTNFWAWWFPPDVDFEIIDVWYRFRVFMFLYFQGYVVEVSQCVQNVQQKLG